MKKIADYRRILGVDKNADLNVLKSTYRNFMKEFHPDKFVNDETGKEEAEIKSKNIIEAYHFLVSIDKETQAKYAEEYNNTVSTSPIVDFEYKQTTLQIKFDDGSCYEYFDVPKNVYVKMINADSQGRFMRRNIYNNYVFRKTANTELV
jgi:DnaJ-class molecular chaperone